MTDRELVELAAKAAGYMVRWDGIYCEFRHSKEGQGHGPFWNPIVNDGDALRLAVSLGMNCAFIPPAIPGSFCEVAAAFDESGWPDVRAYVEHNNDAYAATRRAIVMAAAEIGRRVV